MFCFAKLSVRLIMISRKEWANARAAVNTLFTSVGPTANVLTINQTRIRVDTAWARIERATEYLGAIETELDIQTRWTSSHPEGILSANNLHELFKSPG